MHLVLAANAEVDQPWVADATAELAQQTGATVAVVSVDELPEGDIGAVPRSGFLERAEAAADAAVQRLTAAGVTATKTVLSGRALDRILEFAAEQQPDVIVVGSSARGVLLERLLGSVPIGLLERAGRPVLMVTEPGGRR
ncbi:MAG: universal stress protein [Frankiaceae bacterium]